MKICNSCMQMTGDTSEKCPLCKMSDFTSLSTDGAKREKEIHKLKESKGLVNKPHRNIRKVRYRLASGQRSWLRNLIAFLVGSLVLSVVTNSTIWSSPGNPLDVRTWVENFGELTSPFSIPEEGAIVQNGSYVFSRGSFHGGYDESLGHPTFGVSVSFYNSATTPIAFPRGVLCLATDVRHLESRKLAWNVYGDAYAEDLVPQPNLTEWPHVPWEPPFAYAGINGYWYLDAEETPIEVYYGTCGEPTTAKFRFAVNDFVQDW